MEKFSSKPPSDNLIMFAEFVLKKNFLEYYGKVKQEIRELNRH